MWLPRGVSAELLRERQEFTRDIEARTVRAAMLKVKSVLDEFNHELKRIDPKLELVRAGEDTHGTPLKPGYYHVIRWNDGAPPSVMTVEGEHGEFVEPTSRVFEKLRENDLWDPNNMRLLRQRQRLADEAAEKLKLKEREDRQAEILERYMAGNRAFVSMDRSVPWSQTARARRERNATSEAVTSRPRVTCPVEGCGRSVQKGNLKRHLATHDDKRTTVPTKREQHKTLPSTEGHKRSHGHVPWVDPDEDA